MERARGVNSSPQGLADGRSLRGRGRPAEAEQTPPATEQTHWFERFQDSRRIASRNNRDAAASAKPVAKPAAGNPLPVSKSKASRASPAAAPAASPAAVPKRGGGHKGPDREPQIWLGNPLPVSKSKASRAPPAATPAASPAAVPKRGGGHKGPDREPQIWLGNPLPVSKSKASRRIIPVLATNGYGTLLLNR